MTGRPRRFACRLGVSLMLLAARAPLGHATAALPGTFEHLTVADGLSSNFVTSIHRDRRGFLWFGTADGLNRWDGYDVTVFRHDPGDLESLAASAISSLMEDPTGRIWITLSAGGLDSFDPDTERFSHHSFSPREGAEPSVDFVTAARIDGAGRVWVAGLAGGLYHLEGDRFVPVTFPDASGVAPRVQVLEPAPDGGLWVGTATMGLLHANGASFQLTRHSLAAEDHAPELAIASIHLDRTGRTWVGTATGELYYGGVTGSWMQVPLDPALGSPPPARPIRSIGSTPDGTLWLLAGQGELLSIDPGTGAISKQLAGSAADPEVPPRVPTSLSIGPTGRISLCSNSGLYVREPGHHNWIRHSHAPDDPRSLSHDVVRQVLEGDDGMMWVGTSGGGVNRSSDRLLWFRHQVPRTSFPLDPAFLQITSLAEDQYRRLWLGTPRGLLAVDGTGSVCAGPITAGAGTHGLPATQVQCLLAVPGGDLWVGTVNGIARVTPPSPGRDTSVVRERFLHGRTPPLVVNTMAADPAGDLWLGTQGGALLFDPRTGSVRRTVAAPDLPSDLVMALTVDHTGDIWIGTYVGGLSRMNRETGVITNYVTDAADSRSLGNRSVTCLHEDRRGLLWIGTYSGGLNRFEPEGERFFRFTRADGLTGNKVNAVLEDTTGVLWISTNQGISRFDPARGTFSGFDIHDGLQSNEFSVHAGLSLQSGEMVMGGINGYNRFFPGEISPGSKPPQLALTAFRLFNDRVPLSAVTSDDGVIELSHRDDVLAFEFTALDFTNPKRNRYRYTLDGFDRGWVECGARRYAGYTNLDPGRYTFRVRAANSDGIWTSDGISLPLVIHPPYWVTWWFRSAATAVVLALFLGVSRARTARKVRETLRIERVRTAERERVRQEVSRDFHDELGHQLTKISLFTELIRRELKVRPAGNGGPDAGTLLAHAEKVAATAAALARDARDFIWTLSPEKDSLHDLGANLQDFGLALFADAGVEFTTSGLGDTLRDVRLSLDQKRQITLIFKEAMTNALQHGRPGRVQLRLGCGSGVLELELADDGGGFTPADPGGEARERGLGLANMRRRALRIGGRLVISSTPGRGTVVRLSAPLSRPDPPNGALPGKGGAP